MARWRRRKTKGAGRLWLFVLATVAAMVLEIAVNVAGGGVRVPSLLRPWIWVGIGVLAMTVVVLQATMSGRDGLDEPRESERDVRRLAAHLRAYYDSEQERRRINDPCPLPVRWRTAEAGLADHWSNIRRAPAGTDLAPLDLSGRFEQIAQVYRSLPSGRLVLLGEAGAGKSVLALRLALDLLDGRQASDPVPVLLTLASWNPDRQEFRSWLGESVRALAAVELSQHAAAALVTEGRLLPVLDGFDEMDPGARGRALRALNETSMPLVLTSRPRQYTAAVARVGALAGGGVVCIEPLAVSDLAGYLPRTTPPAYGRVRAATWDELLTRLSEHADDPAEQRVAAALSTALMVAMVRATYSETARDPGELLDAARFPSRAAVEEHLLSQYVAAAFRKHGNERGWRSARWLGYLADQLAIMDTRDLYWWQVGEGVAGRMRLLLAAILYAVCLGVSAGWSAGFGSSTGVVAACAAIGALSAALSRSPAPVAARRSARALLGELAVRIAGAPGCMIVIGMFSGALFTVVGAGAAAGARAGAVAGLVLALTLRVEPADVTGIPPRTLEYIAAVIALSSETEPLGGTAHLLNKVAPTTELANLGHTRPTPIIFPAAWTSRGASLRIDRADALTSAALSGLCAALLLQLADGILHWPATPIVFGAAVALLNIATSSAWGQWVLLVRLWLPLTGALPWNTPAFLEEACRRGIMRHNGPTYQFRHARLQDHLATARKANTTQFS